MKFHYAYLLPLAALAACGGHTHEEEAVKVTYPETRKDTTVVDEYFGTQVADPYRWLEDDLSDETADWVKRQNAVTNEYLATLPNKDKINKRLTDLYTYERYSTPFTQGGKYFYYYNDGSMDQSQLFVMDSLEGEPRLLIDPNGLSEDNTVSLGSIKASKDGKYLAYQLAAAGSDWNDIHTMDLATGEKLPDLVNWVKFSGISWKGDGFYYSRYPKPGDDAYSGKNEYHAVYFHKMGTDQSEDELVYEDKENAQRNAGVGVTYNQDALLLYTSESTSGSGLYIKEDNPTGGYEGFLELDPGFEWEYGVIDYKDGKLLMKTNYQAPNWRLVEVDLNDPKPENYKDIIPEAEEVLSSVQIAGGKLVAEYMKDVCSVLNIYEMDGSFIREVELPVKGTVNGFSGDRESNVAFYSFASFTYPTTVFKYDMETGESSEFRAPTIDFDPSQYEVKQVFYPSKDGTKIPMFIVHKKGLELTGTNPTLLYGYGGFDISIQPRFSANNIIFLENGGVYASANMRGGGEYGKEWHEAGTKTQKQNVFDDFIAAAEYLIKEKYTSSDNLAISGRSNGGLLVGACMTQRPDLYKVALPAVGVLDMLRFHQFTIGWAWKGDYGSSEDEEQFKALYAYSPLHNVKEVAYPATMVTTADHDDRVVPAHSFKFISELQDKHTGDLPVLIRIETNAGHGAGKPITKQIEENTDIWAFVFHHLGVKMAE